MSWDTMSIRLPYSDFLDRFWALPPVDAPTRKPKIRECKKRTYSQRTRNLFNQAEKRPLSDVFVQLVEMLKLSPNHKLVLDNTKDPAEVWGRLEPLDDVRPRWARPHICFRFTGGECDPYHDHHRNADECWLRGRHSEIRGDIATEAQRHSLVQHTVASFFIVVFGSTLRIARLDRCGTFFTDPVNYVEDPDVLTDLFSRLSLLTDEQLGLDPTATPILPGSPEERLIQELSQGREDDYSFAEGTVIDGDINDSRRVWKHIRDWFKFSLEQFKGEYPRWKLKVPAKPDGSWREFLVCAPAWYDNEFREKNARIFIAIDLTTERFVCLKDTWRYPRIGCDPDREGQVLAMLGEAGVPHVPTLVCEGDLPDQLTKTDEDLNEQYGWNYYYGYRPIAHQMKHYRIVTEEIGISLRYIRDGRELVSALRDCVTTHLVVAEFLKRLHGDVSPGNYILIPKLEMSKEPTGKPTVKREGMVIDWETCLPLPTERGCPRWTRMYTAEFISLGYAQDMNKDLIIADEVEAIFYVMLFFALRYLRSNVVDVDRFRKELFRGDSRSMKTKVIKTMKLFNDVDASSTELRFFASAPDGETSDMTAEGTSEVGIDSPLNSLLKEYLSWCHAKYWKDTASRRLRPPYPDLDLVSLKRKMDDFMSVIDLFDEKLKLEWPAKDLAEKRQPAKPKQEEEADGGHGEKSEEVEAENEDGSKAKGKGKRKREAAAKPKAKRPVRKPKKQSAAQTKPVRKEPRVGARRSARLAGIEPEPIPDERPAKRRRV